MSSLRVYVRQANRAIVAIALLVSAVLPVLTPSFAAADQATGRSVTLSSSVAGAQNVSYEVKFSAAQDAGAAVIEFCNDSPLMGATCTPPPGFSLSGATASGGFTKVGADSSASKITVTGTISNPGETTIPIAGVTNPSGAGALYARIVTYVDGTTAHDEYTTADPGTYLDDGGVAMYINNKIGVSGAVLETMTFCVSGETITENCVGSGAAAPALTAPVLKLGQSVGGVIALNSADVYTGTVNTQISTNAVNGAVINLKSSTTGCGGLSRAGAATIAAGCAIVPANATNGFGITSGQAKFGVRTGTAAGAGSSFNGTVRPYDSGSGAYYSDSVFKMRWVSGDADGVTSTYGDPVLDTNSLPVNNMGMPLTFGASAANDTPAGLYSADLSLIATGKF